MSTTQLPPAIPSGESDVAHLRDDPWHGLLDVGADCVGLLSEDPGESVGESLDTSDGVGAVITPRVPAFHELQAVLQGGRRGGQRCLSGVKEVAPRYGDSRREERRDVWVKIGTPCSS